MKPQQALSLLCKFFSVKSETLTMGVPSDDLVAWATQVRAEGDKYKLTWQQHNFLVGYAW